ncbi:capsular biosynthesis protein [Neorhizobium sp. NCHU2750]|uniref:capsular biosynthesis protein n=1 Tax=Neorhizobium sp. NCHU2750 TaxID=1825976 RepID=UPI000E75E4B3|nr:capsular biosynthesis protein [Neorhizobium sp. NCHU2750]
MYVFPMAGLSRRFTEAGFTVPKFMLPAGSMNLFQHSVYGFRDAFADEKFLFVYLGATCSEEFILESSDAIGLRAENVKLARLDNPTDGQATTVARGLEVGGVSPDEPITIFNIDTIYSGFEQPDLSKFANVAGYLDVFVGDGDHWSFVRPKHTDENIGEALEVTEKVRISNLCSSGLYQFASAATFMNEFDAIRNRPVAELQGHERYIAPLYNAMIQKGKTVVYRVMDADNIKFSGTPAEYRHFLTQIA